MNAECNFPYRRYSSEMFAEPLIALLEESQFPFEITTEPEGLGSVFTGTVGIPGIIVMVRQADARTIQALERKTTAVETEPEEADFAEFADIHPVRIFAAYCMIFFGSPLAIVRILKASGRMARSFSVADF
jgi:hypothetical protein